MQRNMNKQYSRSPSERESFKRKQTTSCNHRHKLCSTCCGFTEEEEEEEESRNGDSWKANSK